jgi:hypothetical protein
MIIQIKERLGALGYESFILSERSRILVEIPNLDCSHSCSNCGAYSDRGLNRFHLDSFPLNLALRVLSLSLLKLSDVISKFHYCISSSSRYLFTSELSSLQELRYSLELNILFPITDFPKRYSNAIQRNTIPR